MFSKKGVLKDFAKLTGKHLCQILFFIKVAILRLASLLINEDLAHVFYWEFCETFTCTFFYRTFPVAASEFFENIGKILGKYSKHDNFLLVGDLNAKLSEPGLS